LLKIGRTKKIDFFDEKSIDITISIQKYRKMGIPPAPEARPAVKYAHGHNVGPLAALCGPFRGFPLRLYQETEKRRYGPSTASQQNSMEKPGYDPRFSVFLAALAGPCCPF
jgi:hypothetical protein